MAPTFSGAAITDPTGDYCSVAEIKAVMPDTTFGTGYDAILAALAERASRAIDRFTNRAPGAYYVSVDVTRYFDGSGGIAQWIDELAAAPTSVAVAETGAITTYTTWASTDYMLWPANALQQGYPYLRLDIDQLYGSKTMWYRYPRSIKVVGKFGYSALPSADVTQAAIIQAVRWFKRGQQGFRDMGAITELGQLQYVKALDPDVAEMISHLRKVTI